MSKAVLMSIKPQYCEKIFNGEKTIEVRKRDPKLKPPFKVYVYCTKDEQQSLYSSPRGLYYNNFKDTVRLNGFVIGEFECSEISPLCIEVSDPAQLKPVPFPGTGLTDIEIINYLGNGGPGYGLHISHLRFYKRPKPLSRFIRPCPKDLMCEECNHFLEVGDKCHNKSLQITRPPQSWMYVESWNYGD